MSKYSIIIYIIAAVLWSFNCGYATCKRNTAGFVYGVFVFVCTSLAIVGIASM